MDQCINNKVLAFDFGASSGRAMLGSFDGETIQLEEIHRFSNDPVSIHGVLYWDFLRLVHEIKQGLCKAKTKGFRSIGIDTWGVDFGLLDEDGNLLENPIHYRDTRTTGMLEEGFRKLDKDKFYEITGNQFMEINTVFQLLSLVRKRPDLLRKADKLLLMPDLFNYVLTGKKYTEYSIASTTQMLDSKKRIWSHEVMSGLGIDEKLVTPIIPSGTKIGTLSATICEELNLPEIDVVAVAGHDTQSAMVAVPAKEEDFIFVSCGTWSLLGTELVAPIINEKSRDYNITNEGGYGNKTSFLKNIIGLWLIQESRRQWSREGNEFSFSELESKASYTKPLQSFIDPDAPEFVAPGNIPERIQKYCEKTNQVIPETVAEIVRCINESLALKYRFALEQISSCTEKKYETIFMVGGGTQSKMLCQMTANACQCKVSAGPVEATVLGNVAQQLIAQGILKDIGEAREIIGKSGNIRWYKPQQKELWESAYERFLEVTKL